MNEIFLIPVENTDKVLLSRIQTMQRDLRKWIRVPLEVVPGYENDDVAFPDIFMPPTGRLYLLKEGGRTAGYGAIKALDPSGSKQYCELKELYIKKEYRGKGYSKLLVKKLCDEAKALGYRNLCVNPFLFMEIAIELFQKMGFVKVKPFRQNPYVNVKFFSLSLYQPEPFFTTLFRQRAAAFGAARPPAASEPVDTPETASSSPVPKKLPEKPEK